MNKSETKIKEWLKSLASSSEFQIACLSGNAKSISSFLESHLERQIEVENSVVKSPRTKRVSLGLKTEVQMKNEFLSKLDFNLRAVINNSTSDLNVDINSDISKTEINSMTTLDQFRSAYNMLSVQVKSAEMLVLYFRYLQGILFEQVRKTLEANDEVVDFFINQLALTQSEFRSLQKCAKVSRIMDRCVASY